MSDIRPRECPKCQCGLYEVFIDPDTNAAVAIECNMCGERLNIIDRILTLNQAGLLGDLIRGVQAGAKLRYYQFGTRDADHPLVVSMRAFTYDGGAMLQDNDDIRGEYVWCSGIFERWLKVEDLITALDNIDGKHGLDNPMAVIEYKE